MGISYPGFYAACGMIDSHPALKCVSPQAPVADWFIGDDFHHNGALFLADAFGLYSRSSGRSSTTRSARQPSRSITRRPTATSFISSLGPLANADKKHFKGKIEFWNEMHGAPELRRVLAGAQHSAAFEEGRAAVMTVGGWYDAEDLYGPLEVYQETERLNPGIYNVLVMGPWSHGQWSGTDGDRLGNVAFDAKTAEYYREHIELPFLKHFLKDEEKDEKRKSRPTTKRKPRSSTSPRPTSLKPAPTNGAVSTPGRPRTRLRRSLYFHAGGRLSFDPPTRRRRATHSTSTSAIRPSRFRTSAIRAICIGRIEYMLDDQRFAATRPDVLVYQTDVLDGRRHARRPDLGSAARVDHRHRFRLRRETDRRLLDRISQPRSESDERPDGRLPATRARRADARQVPQQLRERQSHSRPAKRRPSTGRCPTSSTRSAAATAS